MHDAIKRLGMGALVLALGLAACGDDSGGGDDDDDDGDTTIRDAGRDSGTDGGARDGGGTGSLQPITNASASEIAAALETDGVEAGTRRAGIVVAQHCADAARCQNDDDGDSEAVCLEGSIDEWDSSVAADDPDACLDALLDYWACRAASTTCDAAAQCESLIDTIGTLCP